MGCIIIGYLNFTKKGILCKSKKFILYNKMWGGKYASGKRHDCEIKT